MFSYQLLITSALFSSLVLHIVYGEGLVHTFFAILPAIIYCNRLILLALFFWIFGMIEEFFSDSLLQGIHVTSYLLIAPLYLKWRYRLSNEGVIPAFLWIFFLVATYYLFKNILIFIFTTQAINLSQEMRLWLLASFSTYVWYLMTLYFPYRMIWWWTFRRLRRKNSEL